VAEWTSGPNQTNADLSPSALPTVQDVQGNVNSFLVLAVEYFTHVDGEMRIGPKSVCVPERSLTSGEGGSPGGPPAVATELVQAEAPDMGDVSEESAL